MEYDNFRTVGLHSAVWDDDVLRVKELLLDPTVDVNDITNCDQSRTPFFHACIISSAEMVKVFLECERTIDYNKKDTSGNAALHCAMSKVLPLLIEDPRIDVNALDKYGWSVLVNYVLYADITSVRRILASDRFTQVNTVSEDGNTARVHAFHAGLKEHQDIIEAHIADPVASRTKLRNSFGDYPEHLAGELFAIVVLLCDDYLSLAPTGAS